MAENLNLITILGHTAAGKTRLAALLAYELGGEVISADSRQVYREMTLGTGKDYEDYIVKNTRLPVHLLDIHDAGYEYNVYEFQRDFISIYQELQQRNKIPVLCGGSGLYIESILRNYNLFKVPPNESLRKKLEPKSLKELSEILKGYKSLHNSTDTDSRKRTIRAIEIADYMQIHKIEQSSIPEVISLNIGIRYNREERRARITKRLKERLDKGLIDEVQNLLDNGISFEKLEYYGLEYKYVSRYLKGLTSFETMFNELNTAIHQFAKRQMTYFRGMERRGIQIHWIEGEKSTENKLNEILEYYSHFSI